MNVLCNPFPAFHINKGMTMVAMWSRAISQPEVEQVFEAYGPPLGLTGLQAPIVSNLVCART